MGVAYKLPTGIHHDLVGAGSLVAILIGLSELKQFGKLMYTDMRMLR